MPNNLVSCDANTSEVYKHAGGTTVITLSFASPGSDISGLAWDGSNLWSIDKSTNYIYGHAGMTSTISTSYSTSYHYGWALTFDGTNLWHTDAFERDAYQHTGVTSAIQNTLNNVADDPSGLASDETYLWVSENHATIFIKKLTLAGVNQGTFLPPASDPFGLTWDGTNLWSCDRTAEKIYKHTLATASISLSFASPGSNPTGLTWQPVDMPTVTTQAPSDMLETTSTGNGNITDIGGETCTRRGFCYKEGTSGDPTVADSTAYDDGTFGTGAYTKAITGLTGDTSYRVCAYAVNSAGTSYGATVQTKTGPAAPTDVAATSGDHTDKVVITWTKASGATGYQVYRDGDALGWLGDVATYDDEGADAPVITPGTATATDGSYTDKVTLGVGGESVANGTTHTYKVKARNVEGSVSLDSATDTGYRGHGALAYQWQRSALDTDEDFSDITGATTEDYDDTEAPT